MSGALEFKATLEREQDDLLTCWIAFLEIIKNKQIPYPPIYLTAFEKAKSIKDKNNYVFDLLQQGKDIISQIIARNAYKQYLSEKDIQTMRVYIQKVEDLEKELQFLREGFLKDSLTKLWNRTALEMFFNKTVKENIYEKDYILLYFDLNKFKNINDNYGHLAGDRVLVAFAKFLTENFKAKDFIVRLHGDEFVVIMVGTLLNKCRGFLNKLYEQHLKVPLPNNVVITQTFAVGATNILANDELQDVLHRADKAMYRSKKENKPILVRV